MQDINLPTSTTDVLPLSWAITSDVFPGANLSTPDHGHLLVILKSNLS
jgi:hypothetical protein